MVRNLKAETSLSVIPSGCPTLDFVTDTGGFPRGRVIEISGPESSGKCLSLEDTYVCVQGKGMLTLEEIFQGITWEKNEDGSVKEDQSQPLNIAIYASDVDPTDATHAYYAGVTPTITVYTEDGHTIKGTPTHRVLILPENGIARWCELSNLRPGNEIIVSVGHQASNEKVVTLSEETSDSVKIQLTLDEEQPMALMLGALAGCELRHGEYWFLYTSSDVKSQFLTWCFDSLQEMGSPFQDSSGFQSFSGLAKINLGFWTTLVKRCTEDYPKLLRKASLNAQIAWASGLALTRGEWTVDDLEFEIESKEVATTLRLILENLGVRVTFYESLNTFGALRYKMALRSYVDQQRFYKIFLANRRKPKAWEKKYVRENDETHEYLRETLKIAKEYLCKEPRLNKLIHDKSNNITLPLGPTMAFSIDPEDTSKENLQMAADLLRPYAKTKRAGRALETLTLMSQESTGCVS